MQYISWYGRDDYVANMSLLLPFNGIGNIHVTCNLQVSFTNGTVEEYCSKIYSIEKTFLSIFALISSESHFIVKKEYIIACGRYCGKCTGQESLMFN